MAPTNSRSFGDIDKHQEKQSVFNRIRAILTGLARHYAKDYRFTQKLQEFSRQLKRTDKDHGSLPFYSPGYMSNKANRDHCILCMLSRLVQDCWDFTDDTIGGTGLMLFKHIETLETIVADGFANYRVTGRLPLFYLDTIQNIEAALAAVDNADEIDATEQAEIAANMEADAENPTEEKHSISVSEELNSTDAKGDADKNFTKAGPDTSGVEEESSSEDGGQDSSVDSDQLSIELADSCPGDCDTCEGKVCLAEEAKGVPEVPVEESTEAEEIEFPPPSQAGQDAMQEYEDNIEAERRQGQDDDGVDYPDQESLS